MDEIIRLSVLVRACIDISYEYAIASSLEEKEELFPEYMNATSDLHFEVGELAYL